MNVYNLIIYTHGLSVARPQPPPQPLAPNPQDYYAFDCEYQQNDKFVVNLHTIVKFPPFFSHPSSPDLSSKTQPIEIYAKYNLAYILR